MGSYCPNRDASPTQSGSASGKSQQMACYFYGLDDDGHRMVRGVRYAVCDKTYNLYKKKPHAVSFDFIAPLHEIPDAEAKPYDCTRATRRHPKETKGQNYHATTDANSQCCEGGNVC